MNKCGQVARHRPKFLPRILPNMKRLGLRNLYLAWRRRDWELPPYLGHGPPGVLGYTDQVRMRETYGFNRFYEPEMPFP